MQEHEVKYLNIDVADIEKRLVAVGASKAGEFSYRRRIFDYPDLRLDKAGSWLRLRDEGDRITLSFKRRIGVKQEGESDDGMEEIETVVADFNMTGSILESVGLIEKFYQENRRVRWVKDDIEFDIEYWPLLEPYMEIEAPSMERVMQGVALLGLDPTEHKIFSNFQMYQAKGIDIRDYQRITFDEQIKKQE
jgi:adenylate cyclase class 2